MHNRKKITRLSDYAKILAVVSLTFLVYGFFLDYHERHSVLDPVDDVLKANSDDSTISITTSDGSEVVPGNTVEGSNDSNINTSNADTNIPNNTNNDKGNSTNNGNKSGSNSPRPAESTTNNRNDTPPTTPVPEVVVTQDDINNNLRNEIQNSFGVSVRYGNEIAGYTVGDFSIIAITDPNVVYSQLVQLKNTLSLYPSDLFTEIKNGGIPLSIYLVNNFSNNNITGVTDSSYTYAIISISAAHPFGESFYHESYHYIERYLFKRGFNFNSWDSINPSGFTYGVVDQRLSYTYGFDANSPFVNDYAQTAATEDRASTFEYMMASSKASCLNQGTIVHTKATQMALAIETILNSVKPNVREYWERHLFS